MLQRLYRWIIRLHPAQFRNHFGDEMLSIFDDAAKGATVLKLMADGLASIARQWMFRWECSQDRLTEPVQPAGGVMPVFFVLDNYRPRTKSIVAGGMLTLLTFCAVWLVARYTWAHPVLMMMPGIEVGDASSSNAEMPAASFTFQTLTGELPDSRHLAFVHKFATKDLSLAPFSVSSFQRDIINRPLFAAPSPQPEISRTLLTFGQQGKEAPSPIGPVKRPMFEVASVKPTRGLPGVAIWGNIHPPAGPVSSIVLMNRTTKQLIEIAYNIQDSELSPGPKWTEITRFDVDAKIDDAIVASALANKLTRGEQLDQARLMLQSLLADRFKLRVHNEKKELSINALVVAKGGLKIRPVPTAISPPKAPSGETTFAVLGSTDIFIAALSQVPAIDGRPIVDRTGLKGDYLWTFHWTPDDSNATVVPPGVPDNQGPSIFTALREQLGLKLVSTKGPVDVLVIDHVEQPSPN